MALEDSKHTETAYTTKQLNEYLERGWTLILAYTEPDSDGSQTGYSRFIVAWQKDTAPIFPERDRVGYSTKTNYGEN